MYKQRQHQRLLRYVKTKKIMIFSFRQLFCVFPGWRDSSLWTFTILPILWLFPAESSPSSRRPGRVWRNWRSTSWTKWIWWPFWPCAPPRSPASSASASPLSGTLVGVGLRFGVTHRLTSSHNNRNNNNIRAALFCRASFHKFFGHPRLSQQPGWM